MPLCERNQPTVAVFYQQRANKTTILFCVMTPSCVSNVTSMCHTTCVTLQIINLLSCVEHTENFTDRISWVIPSDWYLLHMQIILYSTNQMVNPKCMDFETKYNLIRAQKMHKINTSRRSVILSTIHVRYSLPNMNIPVEWIPYEIVL